ncbi:MAG: Electron transfer DM13 [Chloroflexi bacterium]|jgi:hypothetical protein|nr:MAG: Electron transfer DM13 [Chloroflexota bacterium]
MRLLRWAFATQFRRIVAGGLLVAAIPVIAFAWYLGSPLFLNKTVDEEFPRTVSAQIPAAVTRAEVEMVMETMAKVDSEMVEAMPEAMATAQIVSSGTLRDADSFHKGSGQATIYSLPEGGHVLRLEDIDVTNGPALVVLLSTHADPMNQSELRGNHYIELEKLKGNRGNQNYDLPEGTDASQWKSVVIYCKPFHVIFSVAPLKPA